MSAALLLKALAAGVIVGFVTASLRSWVDRFFLVILLMSFLKLAVPEAIMVNLAVVSLAATMMLLRQTAVLTSVRTDWPLVIVPAVLGGVLGRAAALTISPGILLGIMGGYAILAGLRLILIRPLPGRETPAHPYWIVPVAGLSGLLTGLLSTGGKPFTVPFYNAALGHHPRRAYALGSLGVVAGSWSALFSQVALGVTFTRTELFLSVYLFSVIALTALGVERVWSERLNRVIGLIVAPVLVAVGVRFLLAALG